LSQYEHSQNENHIQRMVYDDIVLIAAEAKQFSLPNGFNSYKCSSSKGQGNKPQIISRACKLSIHSLEKSAFNKSHQLLEIEMQRKQDKNKQNEKSNFPHHEHARCPMLWAVDGPLAHNEESEEVHEHPAEEKYGVLLLCLARAIGREKRNRQAFANRSSQDFRKVDAWRRVPSV
jgi:hypothetical protein